MADRRTGQELDVRLLRKPDKHPTIFAAYEALAVGGSFVLVNDHDPRHLRDEFEAGHHGNYAWDYVSREPRDWRIRITKLATSQAPPTGADAPGTLAEVGQRTSLEISESPTPPAGRAERGRVRDPGRDGTQLRS